MNCPAYAEAQELIRQEQRLWPTSLADILFLINDTIFEHLTTTSRSEDQMFHISESAIIIVKMWKLFSYES